MSEADSGAQAQPAALVVAGYVEAVTPSAALGWVWQPGRATRLKVVLRRGAVTIAEAVADGMRQDLAQNGIGDGRHAFSLPVPEALKDAVQELRVFVVLDDGSAVPLDVPPAAAPAADGLARLQKTVDMLVGSQRLMHRNLQAALLQQPASAVLSEIAAAQTELRKSIDIFELFAVRLEQAVSKSEAPVKPAPARGAMVAVATIATAALLTSCWSLAHILLTP